MVTGSGVTSGVETIAVGEGVILGVSWGVGIDDDPDQTHAVTEILDLQHQNYTHNQVHILAYIQ